MQIRPEIKSRLKRTAILCALGLVIGTGIGFLQVQAENAGSAGKKIPVAAATIGGPFKLVDQNGKTVTDKDFTGQYRLIYFGFTYCPMICPTELAKITKVMKMLGAEADRVHPVFITVDPERDTPEVIKSYLTAFDPHFTGLTGTKEETDAVEKNYKIYAAKKQDEGATEYTMDHSSFIYFIGPGDELIGIYRTEDAAEKILEDVRKELGA